MAMHQGMSAKRRDGRAPVPRRNVFVAGRMTSVRLEGGFWRALKEISAAEGVPVSDLVTMLKKERHGNSLGSAIRLFVLDHYRRR